MEYLSVLGEYGCEARAPAAGQAHAFHRSDHLLLNASHAYVPAGCAVHVVTQFAGVVYGGYFLVALDQSQGYDRGRKGRGGQRAAFLAGGEELLRAASRKTRRTSCVSGNIWTRPPA